MLHPTPAWPRLGLGPTRLPEETFINPNPTQPPSADPRRGRPPPCSVRQLLHHLAPTHLPTAPGPRPARSTPDFAHIHPFCSFRLHTLTQPGSTPVSLLHFAFPNLARGHLCHCEITPGPHPSSPPVVGARILLLDQVLSPQRPGVLDADSSWLGPLPSGSLIMVKVGSGVEVRESGVRGAKAQLPGSSPSRIQGNPQVTASANERE